METGLRAKKEKVLEGMVVPSAWNKVLVAQSCLTLCDPMDCSPPGSSVHGILQARTLEWVPIPFSGNLSNSGTEPRSPILQADSLPSKPPGKPMGTKDHGTLHKEQVTRSIKANFQSSFNPKNTHGVPDMVICAKYFNLRTKLNEGNFIN